MTWVDLIIIYFACGAPIGVHQFTKRQGGGVLAATAAFVVWPIFLSQLLSTSIPVSEISQSDQIRSEIERRAFAGESIVSLFEFRDVFYRYSGLSIAANSQATKGHKHWGELRSTGDNGRSPLELRCLERANQRKLEFHRDRTRQEFVELISRLSKSSPDAGAAVKLAVDLAVHLGDKAAAAELGVLAPGRLDESASAAADHGAPQPYAASVRV